MGQFVDKDIAEADVHGASVVPMAIEAMPSDGRPASAIRRKTLKQLATQGSIWTIGGYGCSQMVRFAGNVVLARLLFPEAFGLMVLVNGVIQALAMFSDLGIAPTVIRHPHKEDVDFYNTIWTVQVLRGLILTMFGLALAWPIAQLYEPFLTKLISCVAPTALIAGFNSTKLFTSSRDLQLGRLTLIDLTAQVVALCAMVGLAFYMRSVWSLVIGAYVWVIVRLLLSHLAIPGPMNRFAWRPDAVRELFRFGRWIFLSTVFMFLGLQSDKLILGGLVSLSVLGIYSLAYSMMWTISGVFERLAAGVLMPAMVQVSKSSIATFANVVLRSRQIILMAAAIAVADLLLLAPTMFRLLYDPRYRDAAWMTQLMGFGLWCTLLQRTSEASLLATDRNRALATANGANFLLTVIAAPIGYSWLGVGGFIGGWTLGNLAAVLVLDWELILHGIPVARQDVLMTAYLAVLCSLAFILQHFFQQYVPTNLTWIADIAAAVVTSGIGVITTFMRNREFAFVKSVTV